MRGVACYFGGLLFAVAVSEGMLRGIRLHLPPLFRAPYYFILTLFFVYPVALTPLVDRPLSEELSWALFGFSPAAALVFLTLVPAIRRGRDYVRDNGSPWRWAWYPWTLFGVLAFAVPARSALLCWSMHHVPSAGGEPYIFGPLFPRSVRTCNRRDPPRDRAGRTAAGRCRRCAASAPDPGVLDARRPSRRTDVPVVPRAVCLSPGGNPILPDDAHLGGVFTPMRRCGACRWHFDALMATIVALAFVSPGTLDLTELVPPRMLPILMVAVSQTAIGLWRRSIGRSVMGSAFLVAAAMIAVRGTSVQSHPGPLAFHLALVAALGDRCRVQ